MPILMGVNRSLRMVGRILHALHGLGFVGLPVIGEFFDAFIGLVRDRRESFRPTASMLQRGGEQDPAGRRPRVLCFGNAFKLPASSGAQAVTARCFTGPRNQMEESKEDRASQI
jgi:hypothetical protein